jgi:hypothetical protein
LSEVANSVTRIFMLMPISRRHGLDDLGTAWVSRAFGTMKSMSKLALPRRLLHERLGLGDVALRDRKVFWK